MTLEMEREFQRAQRSVLQIWSANPTNNNVGTCFVVHQNETSTYLVTCQHVVRDVGELDWLRVGEYKVQEIIADQSTQLDLVILKVDCLMNDRPPLSLSGIAHMGDEVYVMGLQPGGRRSGSRSLLRALRGTLGPAWKEKQREPIAQRDQVWHLMMVSGDALVGGHSGSPVLAKDGRVVAIVGEGGRQGGGIAIPVETIKQIWVNGPVQLQEEAYTKTAIAEIYRIMAGFIPDFTERFPLDIRDRAVSEIAEDKTFEIKTKRALFFGRTGAGKSTTVNCLLGERVLPTTGEVNCTRSLVCGEHRGGLIVFDSPGMEDEGRQENITKVALGLEQRLENTVELIPLLDLTREFTQGPKHFKQHPIDKCVEGLSYDYLSQCQTSPVCKEFETADFKSWISGKIDFFVFVLSSVPGIGISPPIGKALAELHQIHGSELRLFKVFNKFHAYDQGVQRRFDDAKERLRKHGVPRPEEWVEINAESGEGVEDLVKAFAASLPVDVLRSIRHVVSSKYSAHIEKRLTNYFFDYVAHAAALAAVFPVDFLTEDSNLLDITIGSLTKMADFMFRRQGDVAPQVLKDLSESLRQRKRKEKYETIYETQRAQKGMGLLAQVSDFVNESFGTQVDWGYEYHVEKQRIPIGSYYSIGGVAAIRSVLALGLALEHIYVDSTPRHWDNLAFKDILEHQVGTIRSRMADSFSAIRDLMRVAGKRGQVDEKLKIANEELYPLLRPILAPHDGEVGDTLQRSP